MQLYNADLYGEWTDITRGRAEQPSSTIAGRFGVLYVVSDLKHGGFLEHAGGDASMVEVYRDESSVVFRILLDE